MILQLGQKCKFTLSQECRRQCPSPGTHTRRFPKRRNCSSMERDANQLQGAGTGAAIVVDVALSEKKKEARLLRVQISTTDSYGYILQGDHK